MQQFLVGILQLQYLQGQLHHNRGHRFYHTLASLYLHHPHYQIAHIYIQQHLFRQLFSTRVSMHPRHRQLLRQERVFQML